MNEPTSRAAQGPTARAASAAARGQNGEGRAMPECVDGGDHEPIIDSEAEPDRKRFAMMIEGICPTCEIPAGRTDDGMAACACCGVQWTLDGRFVLVRFDISHMLDKAGS